MAAGGIADRCGLAAALALGAAGALIGSHFQATTEALVAPEITKAIIEGRGDTERSSVLDIARGPVRYTNEVRGNNSTDDRAGGVDIATGPHARRAHPTVMRASGPCRTVQ